MQAKENCFFDPLSPAAREHLLTLAESVTLAAGATIFEEGSPADAVYLVLSGIVELAKGRSGDRSEVLAQVLEGDYFGEVGVIDGSGRSTAANALVEVSLAKIPAEALMSILREERGEVTIHYLRRVSRHLRTTNDRFIEEIVRKEKIHLVGEMAMSITHDIRSPIVGVFLALDLLEESVPDDNAKQLYRLIRKQTDIISSMAQEVLDFSKGRCLPVREQIKIKELFSELYELNENFLRTTGVEFVYQGEDFVLEVDKKKLMRVFQNLVNNAVEAFENKRGGRIILQGHSLSKDLVELRVTDNGPGIPEQIRVRLFEPFVSHNKTGGTGLGMAIARSIVQAHGGTIDFDSTEGQGTTFKIVLPAEAPNLTAH
jgi:signal transduction histidine kinase